MKYFLCFWNFLWFFPSFPFIYLSVSQPKSLSDPFFYHDWVAAEKQLSIMSSITLLLPLKRTFYVKMHTVLLTLIFWLYEMLLNWNISIIENISTTRWKSFTPRCRVATRRLRNADLSHFLFLFFISPLYQNMYRLLSLSFYCW